MLAVLRGLAMANLLLTARMATSAYNHRFLASTALACVGAASDESETRHKLSVCPLSARRSGSPASNQPLARLAEIVPGCELRKLSGCDAQRAANRSDAYVGDGTELRADAMPVEDDGPNGVGLVAVAKTADEKSYAQSQRCRRVRALLDRLTNKIFDLAGALANDLRGVGGRIFGLAVQVLNGAFYLARLALQLAFQISGRPSGCLLDFTAKIFRGAHHSIFIHDSILSRLSQC
jgi:hypothetical protein